jgi:hypothetical protein
VKLLVVDIMHNEVDMVIRDLVEQETEIEGNEDHISEKFPIRFGEEKSELWNTVRLARYRKLTRRRLTSRLEIVQRVNFSTISFL